MLVTADRAMYAAKAAGRRRVAIWADGETCVRAHIDGARPLVDVA